MSDDDIVGVDGRGILGWVAHGMGWIRVPAYGEK